MAKQTKKAKVLSAIDRDTLYRRVERDAESWRVGEKITAGV